MKSLIKLLFLDRLQPLISSICIYFLSYLNTKHKSIECCMEGQYVSLSINWIILVFVPSLLNWSLHHFTNIQIFIHFPLTGILRGSGAGTLGVPLGGTRRVEGLLGVHGISQARILEWVAISFSMGSSWPWDRTCVSSLLHYRQILYPEPLGKLPPLKKENLSAKVYLKMRH